MADAASATVHAEVRYAETDAMGIVHHSNYLVWFELARTHLCRATGRSYADIERNGHRLTVTGVEVRYRRPARYGDTVAVTARIDRAGSRVVRFVYDVRQGQELLATGATEHVWIDHEGRPCRPPDDVRAAFARLVAAPGGDA